MMMLTMAGPGNGLLVPSRWQSAVEGIYSLILGMIKDSIGSKEGNSYVTFIFSLFTSIFKSKPPKRLTDNFPFGPFTIKVESVFSTLTPSGNVITLFPTRDILPNVAKQLSSNI